MHETKIFNRNLLLLVFHRFKFFCLNPKNNFILLKNIYIHIEIKLMFF